MATIEGYNFPEELFYHTEHSWARKEADGKVRIGMNDMFQGTAGNIVYVDLPFEGDEVEQDEVCGKIQSRKWIGKLVAPISGEIVEVNEELEGDPTLINNDPYGEGWIVLIEPSNLDEDLKKLMHGEDKVNPWLKAELEKAKKMEDEKKE
jgi:glycine cleavage system H protein